MKLSEERILDVLLCEAAVEFRRVSGAVWLFSGDISLVGEGERFSQNVLPFVVENIKCVKVQWVPTGVRVGKSCV